MSTSAYPKTLNYETLPESIKAAKYAVRGEVVIRAAEHSAALEAGESRPFDSVIECNIGNPQALDQKPITFHRDVLALTSAPHLLENPSIVDAFAPDVIARARAYMAAIPTGTGAYSHSKGVPYIRQEVARFIEERDHGVKCSPENLWLTDGASPAVQMGLRLCIRDAKDAILVPYPQYPLYTAAIALLGGTAVPYYLDEETNWGLPAQSLHDAVAQAKAQGLHVRALAVINPGNPTGGVLASADQRAIIDLCVREGIVLMADEVYQENIWKPGGEFRSFKAVAAEAGAISADPTDAAGSALQLMSFHSVSKGFLGECGRRGGYVEMVGIEQGVMDEAYKLASVSLCSNLSGQVMVGLMVNPPKKGDASYEQYTSERDGILASLKRRAVKLSAALCEMEGVSCAAPEGALYVFPQITLPAKAVEAAEAAGKAPDAFYCLELLDATGIVVVPGSGFGQKEGTWHFRTTILPQEDEIDAVVERMAKFHADFMAKYK